MKHEHSRGQLISGLLFGALAGACATYLVIKNKDSIQKYWGEVNEKVKDGMHRINDQAKKKAEELTRKAKEKVHAAEKAVEGLEEKLHHAAPRHTTLSKK